MKKYLFLSWLLICAGALHAQKEWTAVASGTTCQLYKIRWVQNKFFAVGDSGTILSSSTGQTWQKQTSGTVKQLYDICGNGSLIVAVGENGTICTAPDGSVWSTKASGTTFSLSAIAYSGTMYLASGSGGVRVSSTDGATWTTTYAGDAMALTQGISAMAWLRNQFVGVGVQGRFITSVNGTNWVARTPFSASTLNFLIGWKNLVFAGGITGPGTSLTGGIWTTPNCTTWTNTFADTSHRLIGTLLVSAALRIRDAAASDSQLVVTTDGGVLSSRDGSIWTKVYTQSNSGMESVAWNGSLFVTVGANGVIKTSPQDLSSSAIAYKNKQSIGKKVLIRSREQGTEIFIPESGSSDMYEFMLVSAKGSSVMVRSGLMSGMWHTMNMSDIARGMYRAVVRNKATMYSQAVILR